MLTCLSPRSRHSFGWPYRPHRLQPGFQFPARTKFEQHGRREVGL